MTGERRPLVCFYGDDFTGSTDAMANFHRWGLSVRLFFDARSVGQAADVDADVVGVAGVARSLDVEDMAAELGPVFDVFSRLSPLVVQYKVCSTFDSSPQTGSIGRSCELATRVWGPRPIPVLAAQPELGRWTLFGHHFARAGDGRVYRLDRHPSMADHPVTPALDSDLVAVLSKQTTLLPVTSVARPDLANFWATATAHRGPIVLDAVDEADLVEIGQLLLGPDVSTPLVAVGSGGLSYAIASALGPGLVQDGPARPVEHMLAVSGSLAPETALQIDRAVAAGWEAVDVGALGVEASISRTLGALRAGRSVVAHTAMGLSERSAPPRPGVAPMGEGLAGALSAMAAAAIGQGLVARLVVAGGDTAGHVMRAIGGDGLDYVTTVAGTSALCELRCAPSVGRPVEVVLKGGQIGPPDFFEEVRTGRH